MKPSVMSYTLGAWFKDAPLESLKKICRLTEELKLDGIDWVGTYGMNPKDVRAAMDDHGLKTVCYTYNGGGLASETTAERSAAVDAVCSGIETAVELGAERIMLITPGKPDAPRDIVRRNYIRGLQECAVCARQAGVIMTIENFPGSASPFVISSDVLEALREVPGLKLTYDNGNVALGGEDPAASFARCAEHVSHAHFKDWDLMPHGQGREALDGRYYSPALIGEGIMDHRTCLAAMQEAGYAGYINIEYEGRKYPPDEATRRAADHLQNLMADLRISSDR